MSRLGLVLPGLRRISIAAALIAGSLVSELAFTPVTADAAGLKPFHALTAPDPLDAGESTYTVPRPPDYVPRTARTPDPVDTEVVTEDGAPVDVDGLPVSVEVVDIAGEPVADPNPGTTTTTPASTTTQPATSTTATTEPPTTTTPADGEVALQVESLTAADTEDLGGEILAFGLDLADNETVEGPISVEVQVDVTEFRYALGADWASRLQLVEWDCDVNQAQAQAEVCGNPVPVEGSEYNEATGVLTATVVINDTDIIGGGGQSPRLAFSSGSTLGLTSAAGSFSATSLSNSGSWQVGGNTGSFSYTYPIPTPPAFNGVGPSVSLNYNSASVDGITSAVNSQVSEVGAGWGMSAGQGFIERRYLPCTDSRIGGGTSDSCFYVQNATISLDGHASELVPLDGTPGQPWTFSKFRLKDDPDWIVERWNGAWPTWWKGENWIVRTPDGMVYSFGQTADSVLKRPLRGIKTSNDPCWNEPSKLCKDTNAMPYRWMLNKVTDAFGNEMAYTYVKETNRARTLGSGYSATNYDMGALLSKIEYGKSPGASIDSYRAKVEFSYVRRCGQALFDAVDTLCPDITNANGEWYPDVPTDLMCTAVDCFKDVSFFQTKRLAFITTFTSANGSAWTAVNQWRLYHQFPNPGDGGNEKLWLSSIARIAPGATLPVAPATTLPPPTQLLPAMVFDGTPLQNRDDALPSAGVPYMKQFRVTSLSDELGQRITINYSVPSCATTNWASNTTNCYPMYAGFPGGGAGWGRYRRWTVASIVVRDMVTGPGSGTGNAITPDVTYSYSYSGAAWHHDGTDWWQDTPGVDDTSWGDFRGFRTVTTTVGSGADATVSKQVFYQGMHGDNNGAGGTRNIIMPKGWTATSDPITGSVYDEDWLSGTVFESYKMDGTSYLSASRTYATWTTVNTGTLVAAGMPTVQYRKWRPNYTVSRLRDGTAASPTWRDGLSSTTYDTFGRTTSISDEGFLDTTDDESCSRTYYLANAAPTTTTTLWSQLPAQTVSQAKACSVGWATNAVTGEQRYFYVGNPEASAPGSANAADAKTQAVNMATFKPTATTSMSRIDNPSGSADLLSDWAITRAGYDAAGRTTSTTDANGNQTTFGFNTTYGYPSSATYPAVTIPATPPVTVNFTTSVTSRPTDGQPMFTVDQNDLRTDYCYDNLGRTIAVFAPKIDGTPRANVDSLCTNYSNAMAGAANGQPDFTEVPNATFQYNVSEYDYSGWTRLSKLPTRVVSSILQTGTNTNNDVRHETVAYIDGRGHTRETQTASPTSGKIIVTGGYTNNQGLPFVTVDAFAVADTKAGDTTSPTSNGSKGFATWPSLPSTGMRTTTVGYDNNARAVNSTTIYPNGMATTAWTSYYGTTTITTSPTGAQRATKVDAQGRTIRVDVFGGAAGQTAPTTQSTSNPGARTTYGYAYNPPAGATAGQMVITVIDDNLNVTTTTANLAGQTIESNDPNAGKSTFKYDKNGNLKQTVDAAGNTINTSYDFLNRPIKRWSGSDSWPTTEADPAWLASWTYDGATRGRGMAWTETSWQDGVGYTTTVDSYSGRYMATQSAVSIPSGGLVPSDLVGLYTYTTVFNEAGQPTSQTFPLSPSASETVTTGYDGFGHPVTLGGTGPGNQYVLGSSFDDLGRITERTLSTDAADETALLRQYGYDDATTGALNEIRAGWNGNGWFQNDVYTRDIVGNVTSVKDLGLEPSNTDSNTKECFLYDKWNRLIRAHTTSENGACANYTNTTITDRGNIAAAPYDTVWTFDDINRVRTATDMKNGTINTYRYGPVTPMNKNHRITGIDASTTADPTAYSAAHSYTYTDGSPTTLGVGAITGRDSDTLEYDTQQRLRKYTSGTAVEEYRYTATNQRLLRVNSTGVTLYLPGLELTAASGSVTRTAYRALGSANVAVKTITPDGSTTRWSCASMQNSATCTVEAGTTASPKRQRYSPYGDTRDTGNLDGTDRRFLGQPHDTTSGLTYLNNRYYDATIAAFISVDPLVAQTGQPYLYANGNPSTLSDVGGLCPRACSDSEDTEEAAEFVNSPIFPTLVKRFGLERAFRYMRTMHTLVQVQVTLDGAVAGVQMEGDCYHKGLKPDLCIGSPDGEFFEVMEVKYNSAYSREKASAQQERRKRAGMVLGGKGSPSGLWDDLELHGTIESWMEGTPSMVVSYGLGTDSSCTHCGSVIFWQVDELPMNDEEFDQQMSEAVDYLDMATAYQYERSDLESFLGVGQKVQGVAMIPNMGGPNSIVGNMPLTTTTVQTISVGTTAWTPGAKIIPFPQPLPQLPTASNH